MGEAEHFGPPLGYDPFLVFLGGLVESFCVMPSVVDAEYALEPGSKMNKCKGGREKKSPAHFSSRQEQQEAQLFSVKALSPWSPVLYQSPTLPISLKFSSDQ